MVTQEVGVGVVVGVEGFSGVFVLEERVGKRRDLGWESEGKSWWE